MTPDFERLGQAIAQAQDEQLQKEGGAASARVRAQLLAAAPPKARRPGVPQRWLAGAIAAAALAFVGVWQVRTASVAPLTFHVDAERSEEPSAGRWLAAPPSRPMSLRFSDRSDIELAPSSELRVTKLEPEGATVQLESGRARLSVVHKATTHWTVVAGPFATQVVGTRFEVEWDPAARAFRIAMLDGVVDVSGPVIGQRRVAAGETVSVSLPEQLARVEQGEAPPSPPPPSSASPLSPPSPPSPPVPSPAPDERPARGAAGPPAPPKRSAIGGPHDADKTRDEAPSYEELARAGRYEDAVAAAVDAGWDRTLATDPASSLLLLGDAARLSRQFGRASRAYEAVRARSPSSREAADAAFAIGRLAQDQQKNPAQAALWFATYLREAPHGPYARDAEGRQMEAESASGGAREARDTAVDYLRRYPDGPHAPLARRLLSSPP
jgi:hypothetical protein